MPELPEVETVRRVLEVQLQGRTVTGVLLNRSQVIAHPDGEAFCSRLTGETVAKVGRRGKFLQLAMESGRVLVIHLGMTGALMVLPPKAAVEKHTHVIFSLEGGEQLRFRDPRRFGRLWLLEPGEEDSWTGIPALGPEPLDPGFGGEELRGRCGTSARAIKGCLMNQKVVAGIGNIYSDEILFRARILPHRPACSLQEEEWNRLGRTIPACLSFFVEKNRVTPEQYREDRGEDYRNTPFLLVYGHGGEPCPVCGTPLQKRTIAGRSSVFCPRCQS